MKSLGIATAFAIGLFCMGPTTAHADRNSTQYLYRLQVRSAVVGLVKSHTQHWDGWGRPKKAKIESAATMSSKVSKALSLAKTAAKLSGGNPYTIAGMAAVAATYYIGAATMKHIRPPDAAGRLSVDGRPVLRLPKMQNTHTPKWLTKSIPVVLRRNSTITLKLWDVDVGRNDPIGTCTWRNIVVRNSVGALVADTCDKPQLLGATLIAERVVRPARTVIGPGNYRISRIVVSAMATKATGRAWDAFRGLPDLIVQVFANNRLVDTCPYRKNTLTVVCNPNAVIRVTRNTTLAVRVIDKDVSLSDQVGTAAVNGLTRHRPFRAIYMRTAGRLSKVTVTLAPVR